MSEHRLTLIEAEELGWWYAASLPNRTLAVALASDPGIVRDHGLAHPSTWLARLHRNKHVARRVGEGSLRRGGLVARIAPTSRIDCFAGARWLAVGDAAASCDPISSQGIMNALQGGIRAANAIATALTIGRLDLRVYADNLARSFSEHLINRSYFYTLERRWARSPFWQTRTVRAEFHANQTGDIEFTEPMRTVDTWR